MVITDDGATRKNRKVELRPASVLHGGDDVVLDASVLVDGAEQSSKELGRQAAWETTSGGRDRVSDKDQRSGRGEIEWEVNLQDRKE